MRITTIDWLMSQYYISFLELHVRVFNKPRLFIHALMNYINFALLVCYTAQTNIMDNYLV